MSKKVLVISASPRKKGNFDLLCFKTGLRNGYRRIKTKLKAGNVKQPWEIFPRLLVLYIKVFVAVYNNSFLLRVV
ncbi:hypothetical protein [Phascolarctobacterium faecium]|uniref:hypothetical protein n=1 Tax=Phascolarctobacterium faecium TaxID=33025 RepID=UPI003AEFF1C6